MSKELLVAALGAGIFLVCLLILAYIVCWGCQFLYAWINDSEPDQGNLLINYLARKWGYANNGPRIYRFTKGEELSDGSAPFLKTLTLLFFLPVNTLLAVTYYYVTISIVLAICLAFACRYNVRMYKKLKAHAKDLTAHTEHNQEDI